MQEYNIIDKIKERYSQQDFDKISSKEELIPADLRRIALELGIAVFGLILLEIVVRQLLYAILIAAVQGGLITDSDLYMAVVYIVSALISYLPKILVFGFLYKKYKPLCRLNEKYENKLYYPLLFIPATFAFGMWGSQITSLINYLLQLFFGAGEIPNILEQAAPASFLTAIFALVNASFIAPLCEEFIYRHLLLKSLRPMGDTTAIILCSLIFGLAHGNFDQFAYSFLSGLVFALVAVRYNSIIPTIILHIMNNFFVTVITYSTQLTCDNELWNGFVSAVVTVGTYLVNFSYYAGPFVALLIAFTGAARLKPVTGEDKYEKLRTVFCPVLIAGLAVMLSMFS